MKKVNTRALVGLLEDPLALEDMKASEILLLEENLSRVSAGMGVSFSKANEINSRIDQFGLPNGIIRLPVQYTNGKYEDGETFLAQGLATVFHPEFYEGKAVMTDEDEPYRPFGEGYLDFRGRNDLMNYVCDCNDSTGSENPNFERAYAFKNGLWIGGNTENNADLLSQLKHLFFVGTQNIGIIKKYFT